MLKNKTLWLIIIIVAGLLAAKFIFFPAIDHQQGPGGPGGKGGPGKGMMLNGMVAAGSNLQENVFAVGTLLANEEAELRPEMQGRVSSINFNEGSLVSKGALLIKLNDADYRAQLAKLESNLKLYRENADRKQRLLQLSGISQQEYDESRTQVAAVEADIAFTKAQIDKTEIRAPFSGVVGLRDISPGEMVSPSDVIASIQQLSTLKLDFTIPEKYSSLVKTGDEVSFTIDGNEQIQTAKIYAVEPKVDPVTRSVKVRALVNNPGNTLLPGTFARVEFGISKSGNAILIPTESVIPVLKGKKVMVVRNGMAVSQMVTTGLRKEKEIEITSGINSGDTILTSGLMQVRDSMKVEVKVFK